jgi:hypothetical protein
VIASLNIKDSRYQPFKEVSEKVAKCIETDVRLVKTEMLSAFQSSKMTTDSISLQSLIGILNDRDGESETIFQCAVGTMIPSRERESLFLAQMS